MFSEIMNDLRLMDDSVVHIGISYILYTDKLITKSLLTLGTYNFIL